MSPHVESIQDRAHVYLVNAVHSGLQGKGGGLQWGVQWGVQGGCVQWGVQRAAQGVSGGVCKKFVWWDAQMGGQWGVLRGEPGCAVGCATCVARGMCLPS